MTFPDPPILNLQRRRPAAAPEGAALWALGFRPFYLLAAVFAAVSVPLWALQYAGWLPHAVLGGALWHAHELLFGFTLAVIVGFLFTAGRNWSGQPTPSGRTLQALALLWLAGRVLVLGPWPLAAMAANVAFPLAAAFYLGRALVAAGNRRNYVFVALLALLAAAAGAVHAVTLGWLDLGGPQTLQVGLDIVLIVMTVMAGRVVPMFTNNGVPGADARRHPAIERAVLATTAALLLLDAAHAAGAGTAWPLGAALAAAAATAHLVRLWLWQPWVTRRAPLVWVLHLAYAWVPLHLALRAASAAGWIGSGLAVHALTAGAIGTLTLGMMTRTSRGHTGRALRADRADVAAYVLVSVAALLRVGLPALAPATQVFAVLASALAWSSAWALFAWHYGPWLWRPRADGLPG